MRGQFNELAVRYILLSTTFIAGMAGAAFVGPQTAQAGCDTITANNQTINCNGADAAGVANGGFNTTTVNVLDGATVTPPATTIGINLLANSRVNIFGTGHITTAGSFAYGANVTGAGGAITLNDSAAINTVGYVAHGAFIVGSGGAITLNNASTITTTGFISRGAQINGGSGTIMLNGGTGIVTTNDKSYGAFINGANSSITLNDLATISTTGAHSYGIFTLTSGNHITLNNNATVTTTGASGHGAYAGGSNNTVSLNDAAKIVTHGAYAVGIYAHGSGNTFDLTGQTSVSTTGAFAYGVNIVGVGGTIALSDHAAIGTGGYVAHGAFIVGTGGAITLNNAVSIRTTGYIARGAQINGASGTIALNDTARIVTTNDKSYGAFINGANSSIILNDAASINTTGAHSYGIFTLTSGNHITLNQHASVTTTGISGHGAYVGGSGNTVSLNDAASIRTASLGAFGIYAHGTGNTINLGLGTSVRTTGNGADAVFMTFGSNTLVNSGTLQADFAPAILGDNSGGNVDTVSNFGAIIGGTGTAIDLRAGNDALTLETGSHITGLIVGGSGVDAVTLAGHGSDANVFQGWETLVMNGEDWSLSGNSTFATSITVQQGLLAINGAITSPVTTVQSSGILGGSGTLTSDVTSSGTIAPGNSPGTLNIVGTFAQTGGAFDIQFDHHAMDQLNVTGAVTLAGSPTLNLIPLNGAGGASGVFLHSNTSITGSFGTVTYQGNGAGTLIQSATGITLLAVDGTPTVGAAFAASQTGLDFLDDVGAEQAAGLGGCEADACDRVTRHLWGRGFGRFAEEGAKDGNQPFDYRIAGTAMGGDIEVAQGLKIGASFGYSNTEEDVTQQAASADINSGLAALYANYQYGRFFVTGALSGGWQSFDFSRTVTSPGGNNEADATTTGWLVGTSLQAGMKFAFPNGWRLTPSAGIAWQHQWVDGYAEHGAGAGDVSIGSHQADAMRMKAQLELSQTYHPSAWVAVSPHLKVGVAEQKNFGGTAGGSFSDGTNFDLALTDNSRTIGLAGVGVDVAFADGLTTYVEYDGQLAAGRTVNAVIGGFRYSW